MAKQNTIYRYINWLNKETYSMQIHKIDITNGQIFDDLDEIHYMTGIDRSIIKIINATSMGVTEDV